MASETDASATASKYDRENIFAKILDGHLPAFKVYESFLAVAFLDIYPASKGHTVVIPKLMGNTDFVAMPTEKAHKFLGEVHKVARAVRSVYGDDVNLVSNNGPAAGQTIFHPHFHIIPRKEGDGLKLGVAGEKLDDEEAKEIVKAITAALNPAKPPPKLRKARFMPINNLQPTSTHVNLKVKVMEDPKAVPSARGGTFYEALCADSSGSVVASFREDQKDEATSGSFLILRNAQVTMLSVKGKAGEEKDKSQPEGHMRVTIDRWGKVEKSDDEDGEVGEVNTDEANNKSVQTYKLVQKQGKGKGKGGQNW